MNKIASVSISKSEVLPDADQFEQQYNSIKLISQEILEEKEAIIQQIYKQLKDSIRTIGVVTDQLEVYKKNQPQQINLAELQQNGFLRKENDHYFIIADVTKAIQSNRTSIKLDMDLQIINQTVQDKVHNKFKALQSGYSRAMQQCDLFLKALSQKQQKEEILKKKIQNFRMTQAGLKEQSSKLKEHLEMLKIEYDQQTNQKNQLTRQRQQLCLELSEVKKLINSYQQISGELNDQNKDLKRTVIQLEGRIKSYELQKMEREYYESDLIRSYKHSIRYVDYESQYPEREEFFDNSNKINLGNTEGRNIKNPQSKDIFNLAIIDSNLIDQRRQKVANKKPFQVITPTQSKQSSPSRYNPIDEHFNLNKYQHDSFPEANTVEKHAQNEQEQNKINALLQKQGKGKKQRKVIRINY